MKEAFDIVQEKGGICIHDEVRVHFQNIIHTFIVKKLSGLSLFENSTKIREYHLAWLKILKMFSKK